MASLLIIGSLSIGCSAGTVEVPSGLEDFGTVRSATWLVTTRVDDDDTDVDHRLVVTSVGNYCSKARRALPEVSRLTMEAQLDYYSLYDNLYGKYDGSGQFYAELNRRMCTLMQDLTADLVDVTRPLFPADARYLNLEVRRIEGKTLDDEPTPGTYRHIVDYAYDRDGRYSGSLTYADESIDRLGADALADVDCEALGKDETWYYGYIDDVLEGPQSLEILGGALELEAAGDDALVGQLIGASVEEVGPIEASATFDRCDVMVEGSGEFYY